MGLVLMVVVEVVAVVVVLMLVLMLMLVLVLMLVVMGVMLVLALVRLVAVGGWWRWRCCLVGNLLHTTLWTGEKNIRFILKSINQFRLVHHKNTSTKPSQQYEQNSSSRLARPPPPSNPTSTATTGGGVGVWCYAHYSFRSEIHATNFFSALKRSVLSTASGCCFEGYLLYVLPRDRHHPQLLCCSTRNSVGYVRFYDGYYPWSKMKIHV